MHASTWIDPVFADILKQICLFALLIAAAYTDVATGRISNWLTVPGLALGLVLSTLGGPESGARDRLAMSALGAALGFGLLYFFYWKDQIGAGDVKLVGAVGAYLGFPLVVTGLVYSALVGAVLGVAVALWQGQLRSSLRALPSTLLLRTPVPQPAAAAPSTTPIASLPSAPSAPSAPAPAAVGAAAPASTPAPTVAAPPPTIPFAVAVAVGTLWTWMTHMGAAAQ